MVGAGAEGAAEAEGQAEGLVGEGEAREPGLTTALGPSTASPDGVPPDSAPGDAAQEITAPLTIALGAPVAAGPSSPAPQSPALPDSAILAPPGQAPYDEIEEVSAAQSVEDDLPPAPPTTATRR